MCELSAISSGELVFAIDNFAKVQFNFVKKPDVQLINYFDHLF